MPDLPDGSEPANAEKRPSRIAKFAVKNSAFFAIFAFLCALIFCEKAFPQIDSATDEYFENAITEAGITFAAARVINGGISIVKESSVTVTPFGVGTNLAVGQFLDPLDDVIERLSDILFTTIVSLGIQKIIYKIVGEFAVPLVGVLLAAVLLTSFFSRREKIGNINVFLKKAALLFLLVRVALPCTALVSAGVEKYFFAPRIEAYQAQLKIFEADADPEFSADDGVLDKSSKLAEYVKRKLVVYKENVGTIVETSLQISGLYVALFAVQVIMLPLGAFFLLVKITNLLFDTRANAVLRHPFPRAMKPGFSETE